MIHAIWDMFKAPIAIFGGIYLGYLICCALKTEIRNKP